MGIASGFAGGAGGAGERGGRCGFPTRGQEASTGRAEVARPVRANLKELCKCGLEILKIFESVGCNFPRHVPRHPSQSPSLQRPGFIP